ncbi:hypothetical protein AVEN_268262-1 [Araneus ventricosus]|uniref:Glycosyltransferase family 92 protein n=1 Tax=Araneus ventricosus TaxID=182803 RepID=A0A4Y2C1A2_ARAVE|nr:hypothetical protein AVEN_268262-1 [Araneus ventricosus]
MFLLISYFKANMYPEPMNCFAIENIDIKSKEIISDAEIKMNNFLKKYTEYRSSSHIKGWIEIAHNVFIYSVYIDRCPSEISSSSLCLQFIGIALMNITDSDSSVSDLKCALKERSNVKELGFAFIEKLPEHHFKPYTAIFVYCTVEDSMIDLTLMYYATLYKFSISAWLPTYYLVPKVSHNLAVNLCVRPLYGSFSSISVIEFLAFYKTMGVQHFVFYRFNISESTNLFFEYLKSTNLSIEINPWDMPLDDDLIHEYGQIVFTQDCIVQSRYKFSHTIIVDIDEFIVPKIHVNIPSLISYLDETYENAGSYIIPMVLFCDEFSYDKNSSSVFRILNNNKRQKTPWAWGYRSKYIVRSSRVLQGGVHFVWKYEKNCYEINVSHSVALLYHYRSCCGLLQTWFLHLFSFHVLNDEIVIDNTLIKNANKLINDNLVSHILKSSNITVFVDALH